LCAYRGWHFLQAHQIEAKPRMRGEQVLDSAPQFAE